MQTCRLSAILLAMALFGARPAAAEISYYDAQSRHSDARAGHGNASITYQHVHVDGGNAAGVNLDSGKADTHGFNFDIDLALTDRLTASFSIPFIIKRYQGPRPHNPAFIAPPQNSKFLDDGTYHGAFQDFSFGMRYLLVDGPLSVEPFVTIGVPSHDYTYFAASAVGQNLNRYQVGAAFSYAPPLDDYFASLSASRVFVERTLGRDIDHWRVDAEVGYFLTGNFAVRGFALVKQGGGMTAFDFPSRTDLLWYHHDQLLKHNFVNAGGGFIWSFDESRSLSVSAMRMIRARDIQRMRYAISVEISQAF